MVSRAATSLHFSRLGMQWWVKIKRPRSASGWCLKVTVFKSEEHFKWAIVLLISNVNYVTKVMQTFPPHNILRDKYNLSYLCTVITHLVAIITKRRLLQLIDKVKLGVVLIEVANKKLMLLLNIVQNFLSVL